MAGFLAYEGRSVIDPSIDIVVVVTLDSHNTKTGPMAQAWILLADQHPVSAIESGDDRGICGTCVHMGDRAAGRTRTCYVNVAWAPSGVWRSYRQRLYPRTWPSIVPPLRIGAYGDPAVVPFQMWEALLDRVTPRAWTGYTHLWRTCDPAYQRILMASVDSPAEAREAQAAGWRTFRVRTENQPVGPGEITCPASDEAGHRVTCLQCRLCMGRAKPAKSIAILVHGTAERTAADRLNQPRFDY